MANFRPFSSRITREILGKHFGDDHLLIRQMELLFQTGQEIPDALDAVYVELDSAATAFLSALTLISELRGEVGALRQRVEFLESLSKSNRIEQYDQRLRDLELAASI